MLCCSRFRTRVSRSAGSTASKFGAEAPTDGMLEVADLVVEGTNLVACVFEVDAEAGGADPVVRVWGLVEAVLGLVGPCLADCRGDRGVVVGEPGRHVRGPGDPGEGDRLTRSVQAGDGRQGEVFERGLLLGGPR